MKRLRTSMQKGGFVLPEGFKRCAKGTIAYIAEFDRLNGLKPVTYTFRGEIINGGTK